MKGHQAIGKRLRELKPSGLAVSIITLAELYYGVFYSGRQTENEGQLFNFLGAMRVLDLSQEICRAYGQERAHLRKAGQTVPDFDLLIGATALHHNLTLLTQNRRDFERIQGLQIESI